MAESTASKLERAQRSRRAPARLLALFTEVRPGEAVTALLLMLDVFALLTSYYVIKPVRDALVTAMPAGAEYKSYMGGAIAVALLFAVPAYARLARGLPGGRLVVRVTLFFVSNIVLFPIGTQIPGTERWLPLLFYLWVGVFNMMVVAQFWAFANDVYTEDQGRRLFPLVGIGASLGAAVGGALAKWLPRRAEPSLRGGCSAVSVQVGHLDTFELMLLAAFSVLFTLVNTNGEYMISRLVQDWAFDAAAQCRFADSQARGAFLRGQPTSWYGDYYFYVNVCGVGLQSFLVSRLVKLGGLRLAFLIVPAIALGGAVAVALLPVLGVLRVCKIAENSADCSINNTVRNMLWLPTTREMKYLAKQAVDTFFVRLGDVGSALLVFVAAGLLGLGVRTVALASVVLVLGWLVLAWRIIREHDALARAGPAAGAAGS